MSSVSMECAYNIDGMAIELCNRLAYLRTCVANEQRTFFRWVLSVNQY